MVGQQGKTMGWVILILLGGAGVFGLLQLKNTVTIENPRPAGMDETRFVKSSDPIPAPTPVAQANPRLEILDTGVGFLNVRNAPSLQGDRIDRVTPGDVYEYDEKRDGWYHILFGADKDGWVSGDYVREIVEAE